MLIIYLNYFLVIYLFNDYNSNLPSKIIFMLHNDLHFKGYTVFYNWAIYVFLYIFSIKQTNKIVQQSNQMINDITWKYIIM